jgi:CRISPR/Cas system-associated exonuclease Cas4 (RecB family)
MPFKELPTKIIAYYATKAESKTRGYIGASILGNVCERRIWLDWKGVASPADLTNESALKTGSRQEKFERGRHEEERLIKALQGAGYLVLDRQGAFSVMDGNFQGHIDGTIIDQEGNKYILEIKSTQAKYFNALVRNGVQKTFGSYYLQCQMYMHFIEIPRTLFLAVNKNNGEIYQVVLEVDAAAIEMGLQKINRIMSHGNDMPAALADINDAPPKMPCQYCDFVHFCYQNYGKDQGKTNGEANGETSA